MRHAPTQEEIEDPKYKKLLGARVLNEAFTEVSGCPLKVLSNGAGGGWRVVSIDPFWAGLSESVLFRP
jgi:hypothetical protein